MGNETSTPSTGSPAATIAHINCGSAGQGHDTNDLVSLSGKTQAASFPSIEITGPRADFISFGRSHRWSAADFTYTVQVPVPGEYDVTLVFAETYEGAFAPGRRVFDASVSGTKSFEFNNIDVFSQAGAHAVYEIGVQNVPAEGEIRIHLRKGAAENPFISGIVVGAVENAREPAERPTIPPLATTVTKEQYDNCIQKIDAYVAEAKATAPTAVRDVPQFMFHAPGTPVRGLIMTFHGFSGTHYDHRILARVSLCSSNPQMSPPNCTNRFLIVPPFFLCSTFTTKATMSSTACWPATCTTGTTGQKPFLPTNTAAQP